MLNGNLKIMNTILTDIDVLMCCFCHACALFFASSPSLLSEQKKGGKYAKGGKTAAAADEDLYQVTFFSGAG